MARTNFFLDMRGKANDGKGSLILILYHNNKSTSISLGVRLSKSEWDGKAVINRNDSKELNIVINKKKYDIDTKLLELSSRENMDSMTMAQLKERLFGLKRKKSQTCSKDLHSVERLFCDYMNTDMRDGTRSIYAQTLKKVLSFAGGDVKISDIDYRWITGFDTFMARTQGVNGRAIYMRALRTIFNYARKLCLVNTYPFASFKIKSQETRKRSISVEDMRKILYAEVEPWREKYRDFFFLMFYLIGINAADLFGLRKDAVKKGRLQYVRAKTGKVYSIKIEPEAESLLKKYKGKDYLVNVSDSCNDYHNFLKEMNHALKGIGDKSYSIGYPDSKSGKPEVITNVHPYVQGISTYYSRHSWATFAYEIGIPIDIIAQALGHSTENRITMIYVKTDQAKVDDANRRVIDYLNGVSR